MIRNMFVLCLSGLVALVAGFNLTRRPRDPETRAAAADAGYTLIEVMIAVVVLILLIWLIVAVIPWHHR